MAVKIIRQPKNVVLIGAPTSAAANAAGTEAAPAALRAAGIAARLTQIGFEVSDAGDIPAQAFLQDDDSPRARSARPVVRVLEALQPLVEKALKSGALPVILGGDCSIPLAVLAAIRRYHKDVSLIWCDSDADLNTPATTPSGYLHGMAVAHVAGRGAPELVRFFKEPPLVREPDIALFGLSRIDPGEQEWLDRSPMRKFTPEEIREMGAEAAADAALDRIHIFNRQWALHLDVDVLNAEEMPATYYPAANGLRGAEFQPALDEFLCHKNLAAVTIASYVPSLDAGGAAATRLLDLFAAAMTARYKKLVAGEVAEVAKEEKEVEEVKEAQEVQEAVEAAKKEVSAPAAEAAMDAKEVSAPAAETAMDAKEVSAPAVSEENAASSGEEQAASGEEVSETV